MTDRDPKIDEAHALITEMITLNLALDLDDLDEATADLSDVRLETIYADPDLHAPAIGLLHVSVSGLRRLDAPSKPFGKTHSAGTERFELRQKNGRKTIRPAPLKHLLAKTFTGVGGRTYPESDWRLSAWSLTKPGELAPGTQRRLSSHSPDAQG